MESKAKKVVVVPYNVPGCNDYSTYGAGRTPHVLLQIMKDQFDYLTGRANRARRSFLLLTCTRLFPACRFEPKSSTSLFATPRASPRSGSRAALRSPTGAWSGDIDLAKFPFGKDLQGAKTDDLLRTGIN